MIDPIEFMGKPISYWVELENRAKSLRYDSLIMDIVTLKRELDETKLRLHNYLDMEREEAGQ